MKLEKTIAIKRDLQHRLAGAWREAENRGLSHEMLLDIKNDRVFGTKAFERLPKWAKSALSAYDQALFDLYHAEKLEWKLKLDGRFVDEVPNSRWSDVESGAFFWRKTGNRW
jgi:hypothetical protein